MNKKGERFIEKRVKINSDLLNQILVAIKEYRRMTWRELAISLNISEHSIRHDWRKKGNTIPSSLFRKLTKMHPSLSFKELKKQIEILEPFWGQRIGKKSKIEDNVRIPEINSVEFAEFYGMLLGDGCVYSNLSGFCISSNVSTDRDYVEKHIAGLLLGLFNIKPKLYYSKSSKAVNCVIYSKKIAEFLTKLGFPSGKKKSGDVKFLKAFFSSPELVKACLRGLMDTDGSICGHPNSKIMLNISVTSKSLLNSSLEAFRQLNIPVGSYSKGINIYGKAKLNLYFKMIGSSNTKHIYKYKTFLLESKVPNTKQIEDFLKSGKNFTAKLPYYGPMV